MSEDQVSELAKAEQLYAFLQGVQPEGYTVSDDRMPHLTKDQAWVVIWYLGEEGTEISDHIERCDVCGELFDTHCEGACLDYGNSPYFFCMGCQDSDEYAAKLKIGSAR